MGDLFIYLELWLCSLVPLTLSHEGGLSRRGGGSLLPHYAMNRKAAEQHIPAQQSVWSAVEYLNSHPAPNINPEPRGNNTGIYMYYWLFLHNVILWKLFNNTSWCTVMQTIWKMNLKKFTHYIIAWWISIFVIALNERKFLAAKFKAFF